MIASVVAAFAVVTVLGVVALIVAAEMRPDMSFTSYRRTVQLATFTVFVGLWGALIGCMFWVAS